MCHTQTLRGPSLSPEEGTSGWEEGGQGIVSDEEHVKHGTDGQCLVAGGTEERGEWQSSASISVLSLFLWREFTSLSILSKASRCEPLITNARARRRTHWLLISSSRYDRYYQWGQWTPLNDLGWAVIVSVLELICSRPKLGPGGRWSGMAPGVTAGRPDLLLWASQGQKRNMRKNSGGKCDVFE